MSMAITEKQHLPALDSATVLDIRTRAELYDLNLQYTSALAMLRADLSSERDALARETQLRSDLDVVSAGLSKRFVQLQRKSQQDLTSESAIRCVLASSLIRLTHSPKCLLVAKRTDWFVLGGSGSSIGNLNARNSDSKSCSPNSSIWAPRSSVPTVERL